MSDGAIIPVKVRTARKRHRCDDYPRCPAVWIEPGERYEDHRLPPHRGDAHDGDHWWKLRIHAPTWPADGGPTGCELAAAYREYADREVRASDADL